MGYYIQARRPSKGSEPAVACDGRVALDSRPSITTIFEWDPRKASANRRKHGVDFADVTSVFEDEQALTVRDEISAVDEPRFLTLGRDLLGRLLVVTYT